MEGSEGAGGEREFFAALDHDVRRGILLHLNDRVEMSYTDLLHALKISEGALNFHLKKLAAFVQRTEKGTYILSKRGRVAIDVIHSARSSALVSPHGELLLKPVLSADLVIRRIAAFLIDALIFFVSTGVFFDLTLWGAVQESILHLGQTFEPHPWLFHPEHIPMVGEVVYRTVAIYAHIFFAVYVFNTLLEAYKGQTPGKYVIGIRVVKISGERVGMLESGIRNAGKVFLLPLDLMIGLILYSREGYIRFFDYYTEVTVERVIRT